MKIRLETYEGMVFDMDGLLLDTERIALDAFVDTCRHFDYEPDLEVYERCIGTNSRRTREILTRGYGADFPYEAVRRRWSQRYEEILTENPIPLKPGSMELLSFLQALPRPIALATSTKRESALRKLDKAGLGHFFSVMVAGDQVQNGKPDPEIYLKAAGLLDVSPARCLAFEDSDNGVLSAYRAGMTVIQVPDMKAPSRQVRDLGYTILTSLEDVLTR